MPAVVTALEQLEVGDQTDPYVHDPLQHQRTGAFKRPSDMYPLACDDIEELAESDELVEFADGTEPTPVFDPDDIIRQFDDIPTVNMEPPNISIARLQLLPRNVPTPFPRRERAASPTVELEEPAPTRRPSTIELDASYEAAIRKLR